MIDYQVRKQLAHLIRQLAVGRISNDEFEESRPISQDKALHNISFYGVWPLYSDIHEHKLSGKYVLAKEAKRHIACIILFLNSDFEYRWSMPTKKVWWAMFKLFIPCLILMLIAAFIKFGFDMEFYRNLVTLYICGFCFISIIIEKIVCKQFKKQNKDTIGIWPFFSQEEYQYALQHPIYLTGKRN